MSWLQKLRDLIDYNGYQFNLNLKGERQYKTVPSLIISIISILFIIIGSTYFLIYLLSQNSMTVTYNQEERTTPVNNLTSTPILFNFRSASGIPIPPINFEFSVKFIKVAYTTDQFGNK